MPYEVFYNCKPRWEDCIPVDKLCEDNNVVDDKMVDIATEALWKVQQAKVDSASGTDNSSDDNSDDVDDCDNFPDLSEVNLFSVSLHMVGSMIVEWFGVYNRTIYRSNI